MREQRLYACEIGLVAAHHYRERAGVRGGARARDRRVDEADAARGEARVQLACQGDRRGRQVDDQRPGAHSQERGAHLRNLLPAGQREEDDLAALGDVVQIAGGLHAAGGEPVERLGARVVREHARAALQRQVAADGLAHHAQADETDHAASSPA